MNYEEMNEINTLAKMQMAVWNRHVPYRQGNISLLWRVVCCHRTYIRIGNLLSGIFCCGVDVYLNFFVFCSFIIFKSSTSTLLIPRACSVFI